MKAIGRQVEGKLKPIRRQFKGNLKSNQRAGTIKYNWNFSKIWKKLYLRQNYKQMVDNRTNVFNEMLAVMSPILKNDNIDVFRCEKGKLGQLFGFVFEVTNKPKYIKFCEKLNKLNIDAYVWPNYHPTDRRKIKRQFIVMPLTQNYIKTLKEAIKCLAM